MSTAVGREQDQQQEQGRDVGELVLAGLLLALGVYLLVDAGSIAVPGSTNTIGPRFFPYLVGGLIVLTAGALAVRVLRGDRGPADESEDVDPTAGTSWRAVGIVAAAFLLHALLINVIGWPLAVTLMFGAVSWALGAPGLVRPVLIGGITSVLAWIVFVKALNVALPGGTLLEAATSWL
ncbi:tripartite tricarboxylate transporter TctB family protein [Modestobacter sp. I12A-02628]|uniref:Tripartite tricarboxylate transporter TctB family protein n=1 Tax=Goekera deserti TaxID=2497753 RepID=A0A7K3WJJ7_9ACTN|nr:tripartite tricarboxylate transporter TctB family protein [Goekera deserti]MPR00419.1 tripartite tricarboxylate transporter TctB family protein [Goekera deserti]NDI50377.1 tripartite tricarboxylate transporter TctB family protein [Goekera deserti]NEL56678.1 tripartite tricarboxylate transporter TctB family protein [Goekera deserti]